MEVMQVTEWCLLIIVLSLTVVGFNQLIIHISEKATKRASRKHQRDRNSKRIGILELQLDQVQDIVNCLATKLDKRDK